MTDRFTKQQFTLLREAELRVLEIMLYVMLEAFSEVMYAYTEFLKRSTVNIQASFAFGFTF